MLTALAAQNWAMFVLRGVLAVALGVLAFAAPGPTLSALIFVFAFYAIFDGVLALGLGLALPYGPRWLMVIGGILAIAIGAYTLVSPSVTAIALTILIGSFAIVRGVAEVVGAIQLRAVIENEWLYAISGVVSIIFGAYLVAVPNDGVLAVLFVIGWYALFAGVMYIAMGLRLRSVNKALESATSGEPHPTASAS
jgi:uncharacterized membrane protein HdeD (DUF308 family)